MPKVAKVAMQGFCASLSNDLKALSSVSHALGLSQVEPFLRVLNDCQGAIFTSGVGMCCLSWCSIIIIIIIGCGHCICTIIIIMYIIIQCITNSCIFV